MVDKAPGADQEQLYLPSEDLLNFEAAPRPRSEMLSRNLFLVMEDEKRAKDAQEQQEFLRLQAEKFLEEQKAEALRRAKMVFDSIVPVSESFLCGEPDISFGFDESPRPQRGGPTAPGRSNENEDDLGDELLDGGGSGTEESKGPSLITEIAKIKENYPWPAPPPVVRNTVPFVEELSWWK